MKLSGNEVLARTSDLLPVELQDPSGDSVVVPSSGTK